MLRFRDSQSKKSSSIAGHGEEEEPPDIPAVLLMMRRCKYPTHLPFPGSWVEQPYLLIEQFETCQRAIDDYDRLQLISQQFKAPSQ